MTSHFGTLMWKHALFCKRHKIKTLFFFATPTLLMAMVFFAVNLLDANNVAECQYQTIPLISSHPMVFTAGLMCANSDTCRTAIDRRPYQTFSLMTNLSSLCTGSAASPQVLERKKNGACNTLNIDSAYSDLTLEKLVLRGTVLFYPNYTYAQNIINIAIEKIGQLGSLAAILSNYEQLYLNTSTTLNAAQVPQMDYFTKQFIPMLNILACNNWRKLDERFKGFLTLDDALKYAQSTTLASEVIWGVVGFENIDKLVKYRLVSHSSQRTTVQAMQLQALVEYSIIKYQTGREPSVMLEHELMPKKCEKNPVIYSSTYMTLELVISFGFIAVSVAIAGEMAYEKAAGLQEFLLIVGVSKRKMYLSWWLFGWLFFTAIGILLAIAIKVLPKAMMDKTSVVILLVLMILSATAYLAFCMLVAILVGNPQRTTIVLVVFALLAYLVPSFAGILPEIGYTGSRAMFAKLASLYAPVATRIGLAYVVEWEKVGDGADFSRLLKSPASQDNYRGVGEAYMFLILDTLFYILLAWYFDKVASSKYGTKWPFYFCCMPSYWNRNKRNKNEVVGAGDQHADVEPALSSAEAGISIVNLTKSYGKNKTALKDLTVTFYKNEITAFLGHNGAGKSTTMNILTGMIPPSSGTALISGKYINTDMEQIRQSLGFCPQYDILYLDLTVEEHMTFYGRLKALPAQAVKEYSTQLFKQISMPESALKTPARGLSGGMKRKLSIAIAFIGDPSIVILDEPTSAIDPFSRRAIWDLVLSKKSCATILISTHYMQEADLLGSRIAIINKGELKCCGTPMYLKSRYGSGATLTIAHSSTSVLSDLTSMLQERALVNCVQHTSTETTYSIPVETSQSPKMIDLLRYLEENKDAHSVQSFGISEATLEQVFFKVAEDIDIEDPKKGENGNLIVGLDDWQPVGGLRRRKVQIWACLIKRFHLARKSKASLVFQVITPLLFALLLLLLNKQLANIGKERAEEKIIHPWSEPGQQYNFFHESDTTDSYLSSYLQAGLMTRCSPGNPLAVQPCTGSTPVNWPSNTPISETVMQCVCAKPCPDEATDPKPGKAQLITGDILWNLASRNRTNFLLKSINSTMGGTIYGSVQAMQPSYFQSIGTIVAQAMGGGAIHPVWSELDNFMVTAPSNYIRIQSGMSMKGSARTKSTEQKAAENLKAAMLNVINNAIYRVLTNQPGSVEYGIVMITEERTLTGREASLLQRASGFILAMFGMYAFMMPALAILLVVVNERSSGCKQLQILMGLPTFIYWLSTFIWDMPLYTASCVLVIILMAGAPDVFDFDLNAVFLVAFLYGLSMTLLAYWLSFAFKTGRNAVLTVVFGAVVLNIGALVLSIWSTSAWYEPLNQFLNIIPPYFASDCLMLIGNFKFKKLEGETLFDTKYLGKRCPMAIVFCITALLFIWFVERGNLNADLLNKCRSKRKNKVSDGETTEMVALDPDVKAEADRVLSNDKKFALTVKNLDKTYGNGKKAVKSISFGVEKSECFGLLGVNGAGKTTLFKMLTRFHKPTDGDAFIQELSIVHESSKAADRMSYCPQEDILFETLTPGEHLHLYSRIRGIPDQVRVSMVPILIHNVGLDPHTAKQSQALSGGNKRKLNFAIALLGYPSVIFLDEMTTGMDPKARRAAWNTLQRAVQNGCSAVITSHSMEECESLCNRIAIMVNGQFSCIGSIQYLKDKFGNNYTVKFRLRKDGKMLFEKLSSIANIENMKQVEEYPTYLEVQMPGEGLRLSKLYKIIHRLKSTYDVEEFTVSQTTLEHIFVQMIRNQD